MSRLDPQTICKKNSDFDGRRKFSSWEFVWVVNELHRRGFAFFPLREALSQRASLAGNVIVLRHDVDHDLEGALRLARWEASRGIRGTYFLLHDAWYFYNDGAATQNVIEAANEIHRLNHEVGIHNNAIASAIKNGLHPHRLLQESIDLIRNSGVEVVGTASHGDKICRELGFRNYDMFSEMMPFSAEAGEARLPAGKRLYSPIPMSSMNLQYEAYEFPYDVYVSDAGGTIRTHAPFRGRGRWQRSAFAASKHVGLLLHPIWWNTTNLGSFEDDLNRPGVNCVSEGLRGALTRLGGS